MRLVVTFPLALLGLSALTIGGIAAVFWSGHRELLWVVVAVVAILAGWFLVVYARRPGPELSEAEEPEADEPFEDPVELADRVAAEAAEAAEEAPEGPDSSAPPEEPGEGAGPAPEGPAGTPPR